MLGRNVEMKLEERDHFALVSDHPRLVVVGDAGIDLQFVTGFADGELRHFVTEDDPRHILVTCQTTCFDRRLHGSGAASSPIVIEAPPMRRAGGAASVTPRRCRT